MSKLLTPRESEGLLKTLQKRFENNLNRHEALDWNLISEKLKSNPEKMWSLQQMESTGGEPDVVSYDEDSDTYSFFDCAVESPKGRRSLCYDKEALIGKPQTKPQTNAIDVAFKMDIDLLSEEEYQYLQKLGDFDIKTSSWLKTPENVRKMGGGIFGDYRYNQVFIYHNSAQTHYISRGFRGVLKV